MVTIKWLVKGHRIKKHTIHIGHLTDIPTIQRLVEHLLTLSVVTPISSFLTRLCDGGGSLLNHVCGDIVMCPLRVVLSTTLQ